MSEQPSITARELIQLLPFRMRPRFESLFHYVRTIIQEELQRQREQPSARIEPREQAADQRGQRRHLAKVDTQLIQLIVLIYALDQLFVEGTRAAQSAVDRFETLGVPGFVLGSSEFSGRNENVVRGQELSQALRKSIRNRQLLRLMGSARGVKDLVITLMGEMSNGKPVD